MQSYKTNFEIYLKTVLNNEALEHEIPQILDCFQLLELKKNYFFVQSGAICKHFCYIESGVLQHSIDVLGEDKTTYIALKNSFTSALNSFKNKVPSRKSIKALTDCKLWVIDINTFNHLLKNNKISASVQNFVAAVNLTRNAAISRATQVTMCKSDSSGDPRSCINDGSVNNWDKGWIVFVDVNNDRVVANPDDNLLRVYDSLAHNVILKGDGTSQDFVSFDGRGFRVNAAGTIQTIAAEFKLCDDRQTGNTSREISVNHVGNISTKRNTRADVCGA